MNRFNSCDLFAGIGGIRLGFERAFGEEIKTIFVSEWDERAQITYRANFTDAFEIEGDITKIDEKAMTELSIRLTEHNRPNKNAETAGTSIRKNT